MLFLINMLFMSLCALVAAMPAAPPSTDSLDIISTIQTGPNTFNVRAVDHTATKRNVAAADYKITCNGNKVERADLDAVIKAYQHKGFPLCNLGYDGSGHGSKGEQSGSAKVTMYPYDVPPGNGIIYSLCRSVSDTLQLIASTCPANLSGSAAIVGGSHVIVHLNNKYV